MYCWNLEGKLCPVDSVKGNGDIHYHQPHEDTRYPARSCVSKREHDERIAKWGQPVLRQSIEAGKALALKKAPLADEPDVVRKPSHYQVFDGTESIEVIAMSFTEAEFRGFCFGNVLKYRLRAGNKDKLEQDIAKADFYKELFAKHKHLCREA